MDCTDRGDYSRKQYTLDNKYLTNPDSNGTDGVTGHQCFTDCSKTVVRTGSGVCLMNYDKDIKTRALGLSRHATVFQAEVQPMDKK